MAAKDKKFEQGIDVDGTISTKSIKRRDGNGSSTRVFATDGSQVDLPDTSQLEAHIDYHTNDLYRDGYYLHDIADDYSDLDTRAHYTEIGSTNDDIILFKTLNGSMRFAIKKINARLDPIGHSVVFRRENTSTPDRFHDDYVLFDAVFKDTETSDLIVYQASSTEWIYSDTTEQGVKCFARLGKGNSSGLTESDLVNTSRQYNNQQNSAASEITDASTLSWDLDTQQSAYLVATDTVGANRLLPNSILTAGVEQGEYKIHFNSGPSGYTMQFDTDFEVIGDFDTAANRLTIVTLTIDNGLGKVALTPFIEGSNVTQDDLAKYVKVDEAQTFTSAEKEQARANIYAKKEEAVRKVSTDPTSQNFIDWAGDILLVQAATNFVLPVSGTLSNGDSFLVKTDKNGSVSYSTADGTVSIEYNDINATGQQNARSEAWILFQDNIYYINGEVT